MHLDTAGVTPFHSGNTKKSTVARDVSQSVFYELVNDTSTRHIKKKLEKYACYVGDNKSIFTCKQNKHTQTCTHIPELMPHLASPHQPPRQHPESHHKAFGMIQGKWLLKEKKKKKSNF